MTWEVVYTDPNGYGTIVSSGKTLEIRLPDGRVGRGVWVLRDPSDAEVVANRIAKGHPPYPDSPRR